MYDPKWVDMKGACEMLGGMSKTVVRKLGREGVIRMTQAGAKLRFRVEDIDNLDERVKAVHSKRRPQYRKETV